MKNKLRVQFASIGFSIIFSLLLSVTSNAQRNPVGEIIHRMDLHSRALQSLKADVRMEQVEAQVGVTDVFTGTTNYVARSAKKPMLARLDWAAPREEHLVITGDAYDLYIPSGKQRYIGKVSSLKTGDKVAGNSLAFVNMSREQLIANYDVQYDKQETVGGTATWHLILIPKLKTDYKFADLWVDVNGMPIQARTTARNNDTTTVLLTNIQKNVTIRMEVFKQNAPPGIRPVRG